MRLILHIRIQYSSSSSNLLFSQVYYWDSFWILRGLLLSEMFSTARGILLNFVRLIELYGMIPNGGRTYYTNRYGN